MFSYKSNSATGSNSVAFKTDQNKKRANKNKTMPAVKAKNIILLAGLLLIMTAVSWQLTAGFFARIDMSEDSK